MARTRVLARERIGTPQRLVDAASFSGRALDPSSSRRCRSLVFAPDVDRQCSAAGANGRRRTAGNHRSLVFNQDGRGPEVDVLIGNLHKSQRSTVVDIDLSILISLRHHHPATAAGHHQVLAVARRQIFGVESALGTLRHGGQAGMSRKRPRHEYTHQQGENGQLYCSRVRGNEERAHIGLPRRRSASTDC